MSRNGPLLRERIATLEAEVKNLGSRLGRLEAALYTLVLGVFGLLAERVLGG